MLQNHWVYIVHSALCSNVVVHKGMEIKEPKFRCGTEKAIRELAHELELPFDSGMQDWSYEIANPSEIEKYIRLYDILNDEDKKFVLMEAIIQAVEDQKKTTLFNKYWQETQKRLISDFETHQYTVFYWSLFENENSEDCWKLTPNMRTIWANLND